MTCILGLTCLLHFTPCSKPQPRNACQLRNPHGPGAPHCGAKAKSMRAWLIMQLQVDCVRVKWCIVENLWCLQSSRLPGFVDIPLDRWEMASVGTWWPIPDETWMTMFSRNAKEWTETVNLGVCLNGQNCCFAEAKSSVWHFPPGIANANTNSLKCYKTYWNSSMPKPQWRQNIKETSGRLKAADLVCLCLFEVPTSWGKSFEAKSLRYPCLSFSAIPSVYLRENWQIFPAGSKLVYHHSPTLLGKHIKISHVSKCQSIGLGGRPTIPIWPLTVKSKHVICPILQLFSNESIELDDIQLRLLSGLRTFHARGVL